MRLTLLLAAAVILIRDPTGKWANDPLRPWFEALKNKVGRYCCAKADGRPLDEGEWDIRDNKYRVFVNGEWIVAPDDALILGPNKFGKAIVWLQFYPEIASGEIQNTRLYPGIGRLIKFQRFFRRSAAKLLTKDEARRRFQEDFASGVTHVTEIAVKVSNSSGWNQEEESLHPYCHSSSIDGRYLWQSLSLTLKSCGAFSASWHISSMTPA